MASENTETNAGNDEETARQSEANEHDYAHTSDSNFTPMEAPPSMGTPAADGVVSAEESLPAPADPEQSASVLPSETLPGDVPEPAVGAEVDCPGGNEVETSSLPLHNEADPKPAASESATIASTATQRGPRRPKRPEDKSCACCKSDFERHGRSFNRRAVYTFTSPETVQWIYPDSVVNDKSFLCETCAQVIRSNCKRKQTGKRSMWLKPPAAKQVCLGMIRRLAILP